VGPFVRGFVTLTLVGICSPCARATPLPALAPGQTVLGSAPGNLQQTYDGTIVDVSPIANSYFQIVSPTGLVGGYVSSAAVQTSSGGLDFVYQVNVVYGTGAVASLAVQSFGRFQTSVGQTPDHMDLSGNNQFTEGSVTVASYTRSGGAGDMIDVTFSGAGVEVGPNDQTNPVDKSYLVIVHTNFPSGVAPVIGYSTIGIDGISVPLVEAVVPVPEPGSLVLWGGTFGGLACLIGWRQRGALAGAV
jgi:hypothetical protein